MSFTPVRFRPCTQALASRKFSTSSGPAAVSLSSGSVGQRCRQQQQLLTTCASADPSRHCHHHGLRRAPGRIGNVGRCYSSRAGENLLRSAGGTRHYTAWSPSTSADKTSLNFLPSATTAEGGQHQQQQQQQQPQPTPGNSKPRRKTPEAVAMEEFAALERKLAPPRRKTPEEIAMEEFAALERKLGSPSGQQQQRGLRKASSPLTRPEV